LFIHEVIRSRPKFSHQVERRNAWVSGFILSIASAQSSAILFRHRTEEAIGEVRTFFILYKVLLISFFESTFVEKREKKRNSRVSRRMPTFWKIKESVQGFFRHRVVPTSFRGLFPFLKKGWNEVGVLPANHSVT